MKDTHFVRWQPAYAILFRCGALLLTWGWLCSAVPFFSLLWYAGAKNIPSCSPQALPRRRRICLGKAVFLESYYKSSCDLFMGVLEGQKIGSLGQGRQINRLILLQ